MKNLILGTASLLLAVQVQGQQLPSPPMPPATPQAVAGVAPAMSSSTVSESRTHKLNRVKIERRTNTDGKVSYFSYSTDDRQQEQGEDPVKSKTFSKSFSLDRNDKVNLSNSYGSIIIKTWDKNEIKVDADIKAYAKTDAEAQKLLDDASISATKTGDLVSYKTNIGERNGNWGRSIKNGKTVWRRELRVNMTVYMPKSNPLNAAQEYGNITLDDFNGPTSLKVEYGKLICGDLNNANNYIAAEYSTTSFGNINQAKIRQEYGGGLTAGNVGTLDLNAEYTSVNIASIKNSGVIRHEYGGGFTIGKANNLTVDAHYVRAKINTVTGTLNAKLEYGGLAVENVETSAKNVTVNSDYSTISLGFDQNYHANFTVNTDYASFKYGSAVSARKLGDDRSYTTKNYSGQIGKGGANAVNVKAEYGSVTFK